jgi:DNA-binding response OmpR family regulator
VLKKQTVLIVEDDADILALVKLYLERDGYAVITAVDGPSALEQARTRFPDIIVLDLLLPGIDGREVCRTLRAESNIPILMLTALAAEHDKVAGLDLGADDYVTKPFSPKELVARIRAIIRRLPEKGYLKRPEIRRGGLFLNPSRFEAFLDSRPLELTSTEFELLAILASNAGRVFSRAELIRAVMGEDFQGFDRTIDAHLSNLRRKLRQTVASSPVCIKSVYGLGYKLAGTDVS